MKKHFFAKGLQFSCTNCGHCCRHEPGYVFLSSKDVYCLKKKLSVSRDEFIEKYCRMVDIGFLRKISLLEKADHDCIFWQEGTGCSVYQARPLQCRSYPFWPAILDSRESWDHEARDCPGMNHGLVHHEGEIRDWLEQREKDPPLFDH